MLLELLEEHCDFDPATRESRDLCAMGLLLAG